MYVIEVISLMIAIVALDAAAKSRTRELHAGDKMIHMADVENPGYDWLGRWW